MNLLLTNFMKHLIYLFLLAITAATAHARINVVSLPDRDSVQLTIYNSVDLTLVRETRTITFKKGINRLEFSWANTLIDPTSLELRPLTHADQIEIIDVSFPPRVSNLLEWRINSEFSGEVLVEIRYFTSGISWAADYVLQASKDERQSSVTGFVKITNNSGEDYENAQVRLVVGIIRLVEEIATLARQAEKDVLQATKAPEAPRLRREMKLALGASLAKLENARDTSIVKEGLSEYFIYTVGRRDDIPTGWSKRIQSFSTNGVPITALYKYEKEVYGDQVQRFLKFKNEKASKLGEEPLPDGQVIIFRRNDEDTLSFIGKTQTKYIPINEETELQIQDDQQLLVKPRLMNWQKTNLRFHGDGHINGWMITEEWEIELQNSRDIPVTVDLRRHFQGDWSLSNATENQTLDATKVKFLQVLQPGERKIVRYQLTTHHGVNANR